VDPFMIRDVHSFSKLKGVPLLWRSKGVLPLLLYSRDYRRKDITLVCVRLAALFRAPLSPCASRVWSDRCAKLAHRAR
jgi:hypothetical protein